MWKIKQKTACPNEQVVALLSVIASNFTSIIDSNKFMTIRYFLTEFDKSVDYIANKCINWEISSKHGIPRGGLCLAVALSHKLNIRVTQKPDKYSLIVDDIFETGLTLNSFKNIEGANFFVCLVRQILYGGIRYFSHKKEWIVFPWENKNRVHNDQSEYESRR